jgi:hypothetical protein
MNKNSKKLFLCLFFVSSSVWADEDVFLHPLVPQTMITFNAVCAELAEKPIVKGSFVQEKYLNRFNRSLISSGNFIIAAEQGMVWETLRPFPSTMILGNDFMVQLRPDGQRSVLSAQGNETFIQLADVISSVFSGHSQGLLENFEVYFIGGISDWNIGLLPRVGIIASFAMKITISGDSAIRSIRIFEQNGDIITYTLSNHNYPTGLKKKKKAYFSIP